MINSKTLHKALNTILSEDHLKALRYSNIGLFVLSVIVTIVGYSYAIPKTSEGFYLGHPQKTKTTTQASPTQTEISSEDQDLIKLFENKNQPPEIVKCNFSGVYEVTQDSVHPQNGAKCNDFEYRTMRLNYTSTECQRHIGSKQEIYLECKNPTNPVTNCNAIVHVNVAGKSACEYWVTVKRID